jgi:hypothetical protein
MQEAGGIDPEGERALDAFKSALNTFKKPILENITTNTNNKMQDTDLLQEQVLERMDELHAALRKIVMRAAPRGQDDGAQISSYIEAKLETLLLKQGGLAFLKEHPELRDQFLRALDVHLRMYPFTVNTGLIDQFERSHTSSSQRVIIPNEEEGGAE